MLSSVHGFRRYHEKLSAVQFHRRSGFEFISRGTFEDEERLKPLVGMPPHAARAVLVEQSHALQQRQLNAFTTNVLRMIHERRLS